MCTWLSVELMCQDNSLLAPCSHFPHDWQLVFRLDVIGPVCFSQFVDWLAVSCCALIGGLVVLVSSLVGVERRLAGQKDAAAVHIAGPGEEKQGAKGRWFSLPFLTRRLMSFGAFCTME